jgi:RNA polymerase sigma-70 factor (ECF subfamily)
MSDPRGRDFGEPSPAAPTTPGGKGEERLMAASGSGQRGPAESPRRHLQLVGKDADPARIDVELVSAFVREYPGAPAAIWDRYYPFVRQVLSRAMGPGEDPDDLVQEVFLRLYRKLPSLRDPSALRAFVLSIATRVVQSELRARWLRRWLRPFRDGEAPDLPADERDLEAREALARFYRLLDRLSAPHRTAFVLRHVEGLELTEVAAALGVSLATIKRWLPRISRRVLSQAEGDPLLAAYLTGGGGRAGDAHE